MQSAFRSYRSNPKHKNKENLTLNSVNEERFSPQSMRSVQRNGYLMDKHIFAHLLILEEAAVTQNK